MLLTCGLAEPGLTAGKRVFDVMRTELMGGQYLDLLEQAVGGASVERVDAGDPLQEREVHHRAAAAPGRGAGRRARPS